MTVVVPAAALFAGACGDAPAVGGNCEEDDDCNGEGQQIPGTVCIGEHCTCLDPEEVICCAKGVSREVCLEACRPCSECADSASRCVRCTDDEACADAKDERCGRGRCVDGFCTLVLHDGQLASQLYGDCGDLYCNEDGEVAMFKHTEDYYDDGRPCTIDSCVNGKSVNKPMVDGAPYPYPMRGYVACYGGEPFECGPFTPCQLGLTCIPPFGGTGAEGGYCAPVHCTNNRQDAGEASVDCGGVCKAPCADGSTCRSDVDCISQVCAGNPSRCQPPTCADGRQNGAESGVDCGGASECGGCTAGRRCVVPEDCASRVCMAGECQNASCFDAVQNDTESGVDCGGSCDPCW